MKLRPYQEDALRVSRERYQEGVTRQLISLPTGTGKTVIFASLPQYYGDLPGKQVVLIHREELAHQAFEKLQKCNPDFRVGLEMGDSSVNPLDCDVVVASVPTLGKEGNPRLQKFDPAVWRKIVCDEAHHSIAPSYKNVFRHFGVLDDGLCGDGQDRSGRLLLGVTATPNRGDKQGLGLVYDEIVYQMSILDAVRDGWLADIRGIKVRTNSSLDGVRTRAGDFALNDLEDAVNNEERNHLIAQAWCKYGDGRQTLVFAVDIEHAKQLAATFQAYGVSAEAIWGDDPYRKEKLEMHRDGKLTVLTNCNVLTEGYDDWRIGCIVMARPTKSQLLFVQMAGRGTRIPEGVDNLKSWIDSGRAVAKRDCLLIDIVDNTSKHSLVTLPTIFGMTPKIDLKGASVLNAVKQFEEAKLEYPDVDFQNLEAIDELDTYTELVDLFTIKWPPEVEEHSKFAWHKVDDSNYWMTLPTREQVYVKSNLLDKWETGGTINKTPFVEKGLNSLQEAFRVADQYLKTLGHEMIALLRRKSSWHKHPMTDAQRKLIIRKAKQLMPELLGRLNFSTMSKGEAHTVIEKLTAKEFNAE
jgi:superfamily II DNA or RNA helicase